MKCENKNTGKGYGSAEPVACQIENPVNQMRPDNSEESIMTPPTDEEVQAAVMESNPDENSMESRG